MQISASRQSASLFAKATGQDGKAVVSANAITAPTISTQDSAASTLTSTTSEVAGDQDSHANFVRYRLAWLKAAKMDTVPMAERLPIRGMATDAVATLTDRDYIAALEREGDRYSLEAVAFERAETKKNLPETYREVWENDPPYPFSSSKDARTYIAGLFVAVRDNIQVLNFHHQKINDPAWYADNITAYGKDIADRKLAEANSSYSSMVISLHGSIDRLHDYILSDTPIASEKSGKWALNSGTGIHEGQDSKLVFHFDKDGVLSPFSNLGPVSA